VTDDLTTRYWRAAATLPHDRRRALAELEACFAAGGAVEGLDGPTRGSLLTTTFGYGLDPIFKALASIWLPWKGKEFDVDAKEGRNIFAPSFRLVLRPMWPGYRNRRPLDDGGFTTFRFTTWSGEGKLDPGTHVFKIDYDLPESPFLVREILDELVMIDDGLFLGQALLRWRDRYRRVAWFQLER
jgi:hypothetical protein